MGLDVDVRASLGTKAGVCLSLALDWRLGRGIELAWKGANALYLRSLGENTGTGQKCLLSGPSPQDWEDVLSARSGLQVMKNPTAGGHPSASTPTLPRPTLTQALSDDHLLGPRLDNMPHTGLASNT